MRDLAPTRVRALHMTGLTRRDQLVRRDVAVALKGLAERVEARRTRVPDGVLLTECSGRPIGACRIKGWVPQPSARVHTRERRAADRDCCQRDEAVDSCYSSMWERVCKRDPTLWLGSKPILDGYGHCI
jgi:hypothetical protein